MKSFARNRKNRRNDGLEPDATDALLDVAELDLAPLGIGSDTPVAPVHDDAGTDEAQEFAERLGDLDRFIGGNSIGPAPTTPVSWTPKTAPRNLPIPVIPPSAVAPISHPRPPAPAPSADERPIADPETEAQEFVDRLGDLDRFIGGGPAPAPTSAAAAPPVPATDPEDEAQEFLDRLGDLDRFIGGKSIGGKSIGGNSTGGNGQ